MTGGDSRPGFVRRYLRRGWWLFAVTTVVCAIWGLGEWAREDDLMSDGFVVGQQFPAVVDNVDNDGDDGDVVVRYEHSIFGPAEAVPELGEDPPALDEGQQVDVVANWWDPGEVVLAGDTYGRSEPPWLYAIPPLVTLLLALRRRRQVRRTERSLTEIDPPLVLAAQLRASRWPWRRVAADLYPLEATPGALPVCSVPLISSGGLPIGAAFPVQVRPPRPGPWRAVKLRAEDDVLLRPRRRAFGFQLLRRRFRGSIADLPPATLLQDLPPGRRALGGWAWCYRSLGLFLPSVAFLVLVIVVTNAGKREADEFAREGDVVPVEITFVDSEEDEVHISYRAEGVERRVRTTAPVTFPEDWYVGQQRLAVVDHARSPDRALLYGDLYDTSVPTGLAMILLIPATAWAARELLFLLRQRRLCRGPWYDAQVVGGRRVSIRPPLATGVKLTLGRAGATSPSCVVTVAVRGAEDELRSLAQQPTYDGPWWQAHQPRPSLQPPPGQEPALPPYPNDVPYQTFRMAPRRYTGPVLVSGILAPGETIVLRIGDVIVPAIRVASAPKPTQPVPPEQTRVAALSVPPVPRSV